LDLNDRSVLTTPDYFLEEFIKELDKGSVVLDAGCGTGYLSAALSRKGFNVISMDMNEKSIKFGNKMKRFQKTIICDVQNMELESDSVDAVISVEVIEHLKNTDKFLEECRRVIKTGGIIAIKTPNRFVHDWFLILCKRRFTLLLGKRLDYHPSVMLPRTLLSKMKKHGFETRLVKAKKIPTNQIEQLGFMGKILSRMRFEYLPNFLQPSIMAIGRCMK